MPREEWRLCRQGKKVAPPPLRPEALEAPAVPRPDQAIRGSVVAPAPDRPGRHVATVASTAQGAMRRRSGFGNPCVHKGQPCRRRGGSEMVRDRIDSDIAGRQSPKEKTSRVAARIKSATRLAKGGNPDEDEDGGESSGPGFCRAQIRQAPHWRSRRARSGGCGGEERRVREPSDASRRLAFAANALRRVCVAAPPKASPAITRWRAVAAGAAWTNTGPKRGTAGGIGASAGRSSCALHLDLLDLGGGLRGLRQGDREHTLLELRLGPVGRDARRQGDRPIERAVGALG